MALAAEKIEPFFAAPFESVERRVDIRERGAGVDSVRKLFDLGGREDMPLEFGDGFEELLGRLNGGLHVRVDGPQRLFFKSLRGAVLLVRGGVLEHLER